MWGRWTHWEKSKREWDFLLLTLWSEILADNITTLLSRSIELLAPYHCSKCWFYKRAKWQRRSHRTRFWFPFKCHYFCTTNEIGTLWEQPSKPATMSEAVGYWRPCWGQSRNWRQKATRVVLILDTLHLYNGSRSRSGEVRLHSNHLWTLELHCNEKKGSRGLLRNFICHFISILWHGRRCLNCS